MASNTSDFFTFSKTAGTAKNLQKPTDGGDNNLWGGFINVDLDTIVGAVNATSDLIADANQNELVDFTATGSAVNHVGITNAATGNGPTIEAKGDDSNVDLNVKPKGTGAILLKDGDGNELVKTSRTASAVNEITVANAATGNGPTLSATGDDTNIDLNIAGKGTGEIEIASNIAFSNDTDAKVKLPSGGGIYESDGSTEILTESGGSVTLKNTTIDSNVVFPAGGTGNPISVAMIADESANGSSGGTATAYGSWATRNLDTEIYDPDGIVSLASNQFTLGAGTYLLIWSAPAFKVNRHQTQLYDITGGASLKQGTSEFTSSSDGIQTISTGSFIHTISSNNVYELQHAVETTRSSNGFGVDASGGWGLNTLFCYVIIHKLK